MTQISEPRSAGCAPCPIPRARGDLSAWVLARFAGGQAPAPDAPAHRDDPLVGDDFHLALHLLYELAYRGLEGVPLRFETEPELVRFRHGLEDGFEDALRSTCPVPREGTAGERVHELLHAPVSTSLSSWMLAHADFEHVREFAVHRSAYQLKEADPHSWALPRLSGRRKAALVEIQMDEYGHGRFGEGHAELFAELMTHLGLDPTYGTYVGRLPGVTLATGNLISLLGLQRRLTAALLGHLATFEMTSVEPMARYSLLCDRLGLPLAARRFYDVHVDADEHHGRLARQTLIGGDTDAEGLPADEVAFGAAALMSVEARFADHLIRHWTQQRTSLRPVDCCGG